MVNLSHVQWKELAGIVGCEIAALQAVVEVESQGQGFLPDGRVLLRTEIHYWWRLWGAAEAEVIERTPTRLAFRKGDIAWSFCATSGRQHTNHMVRFGSEGWQKFHGDPLLEWRVFAAAMELNESDAIQSASFGAPQIMGANWRTTGHASPQAFLSDMSESEYRQIRVMASFICGQRLDDELRRRDWRQFAFGYNGPAYETTNYHIKLPSAYHKWKQKTA